jgi:hypothetical protein
MSDRENTQCLSMVSDCFDRIDRLIEAELTPFERRGRIEEVFFLYHQMMSNLEQKRIKEQQEEIDKLRRALFDNEPVPENVVPLTKDQARELMDAVTKPILELDPDYQSEHRPVAEYTAGHSFVLSEARTASQVDPGCKATIEECEFCGAGRARMDGKASRYQYRISDPWTMTLRKCTSERARK